MSNSITPIQLRKEIVALRQTGISNQEVFVKLKDKYNNAEGIARAMANTPEQKKLDKYKWLKIVLIASFVLYIAAAIYCLVSLHNQHLIKDNKFYITTVITLILAAVNLNFIIKDVPIIGSIAFIVLIMQIGQISNLIDIQQDLFFGSLILFSVVRIIYIHKVCPNFFFGRVRKDKDRGYLVD
jgi:hypothetical protein